MNWVDIRAHQAGSRLSPPTHVLEPRPHCRPLRTTRVCRPSIPGLAWAWLEFLGACLPPCGAWSCGGTASLQPSLTTPGSSKGLWASALLLTVRATGRVLPTNGYHSIWRSRGPPPAFHTPEVARGDCSPPVLCAVQPSPWCLQEASHGRCASLSSRCRRLRGEVGRAPCRPSRTPPWVTAPQHGSTPLRAERRRGPRPTPVGRAPRSGSAPRPCSSRRVRAAAGRGRPRAGKRSAPVARLWVRGHPRR